MKQRFARHYIPGNEGKWSLRDGKHHIPMRDRALSWPWCRVEGNHGEPSELPELRIRNGEFVGDYGSSSC